MINVEVTVADGAPLRIVSSGHAIRTGSAESAPCAAASVVLKSFGLAVVRNTGCTVQVQAEEPGSFDVQLGACEDRRWIIGVWAVTETSLREIAAAWPDEVRLTITEEKRYGS
ncbi:MAG: hypothetical protein WD492_08605 [Alkalispirochaeta sp.]